MPLIFCTDKTGDGDAMSKIRTSEPGGGSDTETDRLMIHTSTSTFSYCWGLIPDISSKPEVLGITRYFGYSQTGLGILGVTPQPSWVVVGGSFKRY